MVQTMRYCTLTAMQNRPAVTEGINDQHDGERRRHGREEQSPEDRPDGPFRGANLAGEVERDVRTALGTAQCHETAEVVMAGRAGKVMGLQMRAKCRGVFERGNWMLFLSLHAGILADLSGQQVPATPS